MLTEDLRVLRSDVCHTMSHACFRWLAMAGMMGACLIVNVRRSDLFSSSRGIRANNDCQQMHRDLDCNWLRCIGVHCGRRVRAALEESTLRCTALRVALLRR